MITIGVLCWDLWVEKACERRLVTIEFDDAIQPHISA